MDDELDIILDELRAANYRAKRAPQHLKFRAHKTLDDLLYAWELATAVRADLEAMGTE